MKKFKVLYNFSVNKQSTTEEKQAQVIDGKEVTVVTPVVKETPFEFAFKKPDRDMYDSAELFYNVEVGKGLTAGMISSALLAKRLENDGGMFSEQDRKAYGDKFLEFFTLEEKLQDAMRTPKESRTEEQKALFEEMIKHKGIVIRELQNFELRQQSLFGITAEARGRKNTIQWWLLALLYIKEGEEWKQFFVGEDHSTRLDFLRRLDDDEELPKEERDFLIKVAAHAGRAINIWFYNRTATQEDIAKEVKRQEVAESHTFFASLRKDDTILTE